MCDYVFPFAELIDFQSLDGEEHLPIEFYYIIHIHASNNVSTPNNHNSADNNDAELSNYFLLTLLTLMLPSSVLKLTTIHSPFYFLI